MRIILFLALLVPGLLRPASDWRLDYGLLASAGMGRFSTDPTSGAVPAGTNNLYALFPPSATGRGELGPVGGVGLQVMLRRKHRFFTSVELVADGVELNSSDTLTFLDGTVVNRRTSWDYSGLRTDLILGWAWPRRWDDEWTWSPHLAAGGWYEAITGRRKTISADNGPATEVRWTDAPPDDAGGLISVGLDWVRQEKGGWPSRVGIDLRWREGRTQPEPGYGGDRPLRAFEAVLSLPLMVHYF